MTTSFLRRLLTAALISAAFAALAGLAVFAYETRIPSSDRPSLLDLLPGTVNAAAVVFWIVMPVVSLLLVYKPADEMESEHHFRQEKLLGRAQRRARNFPDSWR
jgi:hypothetical protein